MVNWRIEGIDGQGETRFVEYDRGEYRADPLTGAALSASGEETTLEWVALAPLTGDPYGSEWNWFAAGRRHLTHEAGCGSLEIWGTEPELPEVHHDHGRGCIPDPSWEIRDCDPVAPLMEDIYQVFRRTRDYPLKEHLPARLCDEVGDSFIGSVLQDNPALERRCRAVHWVRLAGEVRDEDVKSRYLPYFVEMYGGPADPSEVELATRYPRLYITETRNLLRLEVIARLGDALRHKLPESLAEDLDTAVEISLATRDTSWPRYLNRE